MPQKESILNSWKSRGLKITAVTSSILLAAGIVSALVLTPNFATENFGGLAHKIIYLHVPFAIVSFSGFFFGFVAAVGYLISSKKKYEDISRSFIETGFLFSMGVILSGPLWAKPVWGVWWSFEPRLNTFLIMWTLYAVYLLIPPFLARTEIRRKFRGVMATVNFLTVPMVYFSVYMIDPAKQNHPTQPELASSMTWTIRLNMLALFLLLLCLTTLRYVTLRLKRIQHEKMIGAK